MSIVHDLWRTSSGLVQYSSSSNGAPTQNNPAHGMSFVNAIEDWKGDPGRTLKQTDQKTMEIPWGQP